MNELTWELGIDESLRDFLERIGTTIGWESLTPFSYDPLAAERDEE